MTFLAATSSYEDWLAQQITVVEADLDRKHQLMADEHPFTFFRATYYRWLQRMPRLAPELDGPFVACVGDLHMENFGTWQTPDGPLAWGVNDFDESEELPYTYDLARLATSASLAIEEQKVAMIDAAAAHAAILRGYTDQLAGGGAPFLLDGSHERLARLVADAAAEPEKWWKKVETDAVEEGVETVPGAALTALEEVQPTPGWDFRLYRRVAGVGSLGHRRFAAVGPWGGAKECREAKEMAAPAGAWLGHPPSRGALDVPMVRATDPWQARYWGWSVRRIAPDCTKLELDRLHSRGNETRLFGWMGRETANIHLGTPDRIGAIRDDLRRRRGDWLSRAAQTLAEATRDDWQQWRKDYDNRHRG